VVEYQHVGLAKKKYSLVLECMSKSQILSVRFTEDQKKRIDAMAQKSGVSLSTLGAQCLLSACDYFDEHGDIPMPPAIVRVQEAHAIKAGHCDDKKQTA
jgi:hypothetical protein